MGLGKQITFDKDMKDILEQKFFLLVSNHQKIVIHTVMKLKFSIFLSNAAILDEKTYSLYSKELSLQGAHVVESNSFKKQFKSKRDEKK